MHEPTWYNFAGTFGIIWRLACPTTKWHLQNCHNCCSTRNVSRFAWIQRWNTRSKTNRNLHETDRMQQVSQLSNCALVTTVDKHHFQVAAFFVPVLLPNMQELSELLIHSPLPLAYPLGFGTRLKPDFEGWIPVQCLQIWEGFAVSPTTR